MTLIENLFTSQDYQQAPERIDWDPLKEPDALLDAQLLDCRVCPTANRAALLIDMRTALHYRTGNSALLVIRGLQSFQWSGAAQALKLMAFTVMSGQPTEVDRGWRMDLDFFPASSLSVGGERADFYLLNTNGTPAAQPSYPDHDLDQVRHGLPWWDSECTILQSSTSVSGG
ncbi:hypothetical protein [Streptomyces sp. NBC_01244]|uniref:hypothetical protein n=1 Tax=Streptomyces sp. NBC_01244 TaxID=2903797 RepID=UPI002E14BAAF|nr:hypothetical protein OG247_41405 [Streptomyces sp. NBC_01244]